MTEEKSTTSEENKPHSGNLAPTILMFALIALAIALALARIIHAFGWA